MGDAENQIVPIHTITNLRFEMPSRRSEKSQPQLESYLFDFLEKGLNFPSGSCRAIRISFGIDTQTDWSQSGNSLTCPNPFVGDLNDFSGFSICPLG